ncbi:helix-turn-helix transcriptional regulator [Actinoplanes sp. NPDC026619]|uniref:helix-turn-helix transcriptional regulator n=1 Tax=Actinoplanes sp. NPDC026619 TaxID=3155798 RepID=UPI0033D1F375
MPTRSLAQETNQLALMVRSWRARLSPRDIPGLSASYPQTRGRSHASKELLALLTGYSLGWYSALERGEPQNYGEDFLNRVAQALRLNPAEKNHLFVLATGHEAPADHDSRIRPTPTIERILDALPWPAYINDDAWELVAFNTHMSTWFPWVAGTENNVMRWVFTYPDAKRQLHNWGTEWAPQMFAQMQYALARQPDNKRLAALIDEILDHSEEARRFKDQPLTFPHPDGQRRTLRLPLHRKLQAIELVAFEPMRAAGSRCMMLIPLGPEG